MKVVVKYNLDDEGDAFKYNCALRSTNMFHTLSEFSAWLRSECKHSETPANAEVCMDKFWEILKENEVDLEI